MSIQLPELPYARDALVPVISAETLDYHYGKHHAAYVANLNRMTEGGEFADKSLEDIMQTAPAGPIFNNAAQIWNHSFYFLAFSANGGEPDGAMAAAIDQAFGSFDSFKEKMTASATGLFGSGWTWLVQSEDGALQIVNTANAGNPLTDGLRPLLTIDVWEHAYYIDYRNARPQYLKSIWDIIDWSVVSGRLAD